MKIVEIREENAARSARTSATRTSTSSKMTLSLVAVVTDVIRDGKPVVGYGFNSNGRYGQGQADARALHSAPAGSRRRTRWSTPAARTSIRTRSGPRCSPTRSPVATASARWPIGTDRHGGVGRGREDRGQAAVPAARRPLRRRQAESARSSSTPPAATTTRARTTRSCTDEMRSYHRPRLHGRQEEDRRRVARRGPAPHRLDPERCSGRARSCAVDANGRFDLDTAIAYAQGAVAVRPVLVRGAGRSARLRAAGRRCATTTRTRWPPARTCSRCRTRAT